MNLYSRVYPSHITSTITCTHILSKTLKIITHFRIVVTQGIACNIKQKC